MTKIMSALLILVFGVPSFAQQSTYLGTLSSNPYAADSTSSPYGQYGSPYSPNSINNWSGL
jgi:hypothetical protein